MILKYLDKNSYVIKYKSLFKGLKLELSYTLLLKLLIINKLLKQKHLK